MSDTVNTTRVVRWLTADRERRSNDVLTIAWSLQEQSHAATERQKKAIRVNTASATAAAAGVTQ